MTLPTLAHAHVLELRHAATAERLNRDQLLERDSTRIRDLEAYGLLTWDGGAGLDSGQWVQLRPDAVVVTPAGHGALAMVDLTIIECQAIAMSKPAKKPK